MEINPTIMVINPVIINAFESIKKPVVWVMTPQTDTTFFHVDIFIFKRAVLL